jgi:hypothetical protein
MSNNICRCGTAQRIRAAMLKAAEIMRSGPTSANRAGGEL